MIFLLNKSQFSVFVVKVNPFAPRDLAEKRVLKLVEWFSGHLGLKVTQQS